MDHPFDEAVGVALEKRRSRPEGLSPGGREGLLETVVNVAAGVTTEPLGLLPVVFGQGQVHPVDGTELPAVVALGRIPPDLLHEPVDVEELAEDRPVPVTP